MGEEVKWLLKEGDGLIFECFDISLESTPTLHVVYISTPTTNRLSTLVPSQSYITGWKTSALRITSFRVILIIWEWVANLVWGVGVLLNNNDPLQKLFAKEGGGLIFEGGLNFWRLRYKKYNKKYKVTNKDNTHTQPHTRSAEGPASPCQHMLTPEQRQGVCTPADIVLTSGGRPVCTTNWQVPTDDAVTNFISGVHGCEFTCTLH